MATSASIAFADKVFNPWRGCVEVSEGCANCYARTMSRRNPTVLGVWGPVGVGTRPIAARSQWQLPWRWNDKAAQDGTRPRVFCASLADVFEDHPDLVVPRKHLFGLVEGTRHLRWLLLTKRPENIKERIHGNWRHNNQQYDYRHIWMGATAENQRRFDERVQYLSGKETAFAGVRFLSCEPLLGPIDLGPWIGQGRTRINRVIVGGESGNKSRAMEMEWIEGIVMQCQQAGVPVFVNQMGARCKDGLHELRFKGKGGGWDDIPDHLRIRECPAV